MTINEMEQRGSRLARASEDVVAPARLTDAVMGSLRASEPSLLDGVRRLGGVALAIAALAAAATLVVDMQSEASLDEETLATFPVIDDAD
jgi:hypothetical protein